MRRIIGFYIVGLLILFFNDWFWKYQFHNWLTGKLSDFIGLLIFPMFLCVFSIRFKNQIILGVGLGFIIWKTPIMNKLIELWNWFSLFQINRIIDYSDYLALSSLFISYKLISTIEFKEIQVKIWEKRSRIGRFSAILFSLFVFCSTSKMKPYYPSGDILIDKFYEIENMKDSTLLNIKKLGFEIKRDSIYAGEYGGIGEPYYQIPVIKFNGYSTVDTIRFLNFQIYENEKKNATSLRVINLSVEEDWELQDWRTLKQQKKYYIGVIEEELINKLNK